ncbi:EF-hand domain-containing protein [Novosphingobium colocasiae]|uniref:EF-hand domain-containing protein n=1 Tax=Novosphingobium colocasiae TaxID=1256513 RepID=UPI0035AF7B96
MKTTIAKTLLALSAGTLAIGSIAYAQMPEGHERPKMDANGDGVITRAESQAAAEAMFTRMDVNKDGKLDKADREAHMAEMTTKMFAKLDANGDGSISRTEFMAAGPMDHHGGPDGPPPPGDDMAGMDHGKPGGKHGGGHHGRGHRGMGGGMGMMMAKMADTNNDGAVSKAEFMAAATKHFDEADANKDGKITKEERQAMHQKMRAAWKDRRGGGDAPDGPGAPDDDGE